MIQVLECPKCGYDHLLAGPPEQHIYMCPNCGHVFYYYPYY